MEIEKKENYLIGLDLGTSAIKGVLIDSSGKIISESSKDTSFINSDKGVIELDPENHYSKVCSVIKKLGEEVDGNVAALAMAVASGNALLCDKNGSPLTNIISWMDKRCAGNLPESLKKFDAEKVREVVGWGCVEIFPLAHIAWFKENTPDIFSKAEKICMNNDWLTYRFTGNWLLDYSTATTFHLQHQESKKYHKPFLDVLGIEEDQLSKLIPSGMKCGELTEKALANTGLQKGVEFVSGTFDHPSGARAMGVLDEGKLMLSCGTSWVGFYPEKNRDKIIADKILCDPFLSDKNGCWGAIFSVPCIGQAIDWYVDNLIAPGEKDKLRIFDNLAAEAEEGAGGLVIDLTEEPKTIEADRKNISLAVMESAARLLNEKFEALKKEGLNITEAVLIGGPSNSPVWPGIIEKITGLKLKIGSRSAGAKGAALLAGIGIGIYKDEFDAFEKAGEK